MYADLRRFSSSVAVMMGVFVARKSGGHLNPAVTLTNCVFRGFPWHKFPVYAIAQLLGAMLAAMVVYANYISAIDLLEGAPGVRTIDGTAGIFSTYPVPFLSTKGQFLSEFLCSAILMIGIFALVDAGLGNLMPLFLLFLIFGIGASFGWETGYAMSLARDFGPRLACYFIGYGDLVFTAGGSYFWVCCLLPSKLHTQRDEVTALDNLPTGSWLLTMSHRTDSDGRTFLWNLERRSSLRRTDTRRG